MPVNISSNVGTFTRINLSQTWSRVAMYNVVFFHLRETVVDGTRFRLMLSSSLEVKENKSRNKRETVITRENYEKINSS